MPTSWFLIALANAFSAANAIGLAALIGWSARCAAEPVDPGPVRVGDRWSCEVKDGATGDRKHSVAIVVIEINDKEITTRHTLRGMNRYQTVVHNRQWGVIDNGVMQFQPSGFEIRSPLQVGKQWRSDANVKNLSSGATMRSSAVLKVLGQEQVTTTAGTFDTYRIEVNERQVDPRDQTKAYIVTHVIWYAPSVNRWVKSTYEGRSEGRVRDSSLHELTEYSREP